MPQQLVKEIPGLPVICDPSHIAGHRALIPEVTAQALALMMDGLMLEVHHNPDKALTDPLQQITPQMLAELLDELNKASAQNPLQQLKIIRSLIDENDYKMLDILAERMTLASDIGILKKKTKTGVLQAERLKDIITDRLSRAEELGLSKSFINNIIQLIHEESVTLQSK